MTLAAVAFELTRRLCSLFTPGANGVAPWQGDKRWFADNPNCQGLTCAGDLLSGRCGVAEG